MKIPHWQTQRCQLVPKCSFFNYDKLTKIHGHIGTMHLLHIQVSMDRWTIYRVFKPFQYPPGYLEAQEAKEKEEQEQMQVGGDKKKQQKLDFHKKKKRKVDEDDEEDDDKSSDLSKNKKAPKGKIQDFFKKQSQAYKLSAEVDMLINLDLANAKLWSECKEELPMGKLKFLNRISEVFACVICQEVVFEPVTTDCSHNICKKCLKRSFSCGVFTCPCCRFDIGKNYEFTINTNLDEVLKMLFPGYEIAR